MTVYIGHIAVDTDSILTASRVAIRATQKDAMRGTVTVGGKRYRWSTIQQYEYHDGFTAKRRCRHA